MSAVCFLVIILGTTTSFAYDDTSSMSDQDFFGAWNGSSWTTVGKIDYSFDAGLADVETYVKAGNYTSAKEELLDYYQARTSREAIPYDSSVRNTEWADLYCDKIMTAGSETYVAQFEVGSSDDWVEIDVTEAVKSAYDTGGITFIIMARNADEQCAIFNTREAASNNPVLEADVDSNTYTDYASKDTYIRPGTYGTTNYGTNTSMESKHWGSPFDDYERRSYIQFDFDNIPNPDGVNDTVILELYGHHSVASGTKEMMVFSTGNLAWSETSLTWNTTKGCTFSWQNEVSGVDWELPESGVDSQWINTVSRFGYLTKLVYEYDVTSNEKYAAGAIDLILDFIDDTTTSSPDPEDVPEPLFYRSLDAGLRAKTWVNVLDYLIDENCSSLDSNAFTAILKYIWQMGNELSDTTNVVPLTPNITNWEPWNEAAYHPYSNWSVSENTGLYFMSVYFPEFSDASIWQTLANDRFDAQMTDELFYKDGSYVEPSTMYSSYMLGTYLSVKEFAEINDQSLPADFDTALENFAEYVMDYLFPNGYDPQYGDSDYINFKNYLAEAGEYFDNDALTYVGSSGSEGTASTKTSAVYDDLQKMAIMRTGWDIDDLYININCGYGNVSHAHPDSLSIIAYAYGKPLLVDPGRKDYNYSDTTTIWLRGSTEAHNTIEIDDTAQDLYDRGEINSRITNGSFDFFEGYSNAYEDTKHTRSVLFIKPNYWIVSDIVLSDSDTTKFNQAWHFLPDAAPSINAQTDKVTTNTSGEANIQIIPADPGNITASLEDGYYSKAYGVYSEAEYVSYIKNVAGDVTFDTVLYPTENGTSNNVSVTRLTTPNVDTTVATALEINLDGGNNGDVGYYYMSHETLPETARSFGTYNFNGKLAYIQEDYQGNYVNASVISGTALKDGTTNLISNSSIIEDISVEWNGTTLNIYGTGLTADTSSTTAIAIYAPSVSSVNLNGSSVSFTQSGNYVYAARQLPVSTKLVNLVDDDFNSDTTDGAPSGWTISETNGTVKVKEEPSSSDKSVEISKTSSSGTTSAYKTFVEQSGIVVVEAKILANENNLSGKCSPYIYSSSGSAVVSVTFGGDGYISTYTEGQWTHVQSYSSNTWYTLKFVIDTDTDRFDMYIDGDIILSNAHLRNEVDDIAEVKFYIGDNSTGEFNFDDVEIWGQYIANDNFNNDTTNGDPSGWTVSETNGTVTVKEEPSSSDKSVEISKTGSSGETVVYKTFDPKSGIVIVEAKVLAAEDNLTGKCCPYIYNSSGTNAVAVTFGGDGYIATYTGGQWTHVQAYSEDTWYTLKFVINTDTDKFDFYIDDIKKLSQASLRNAVDYIAKVSFYIGNNTGEFNFDDVRVHK